MNVSQYLHLYAEYTAAFTVARLEAEYFIIFPFICCMYSIYYIYICIHNYTYIYEFHTYICIYTSKHPDAKYFNIRDAEVHGTFVGHFLIACESNLNSLGTAHLT